MRRPGLLLALVTASSLASSAQGAELSANQRTPFALLLDSPQGPGRSVSRSQIIKTFEELFNERTSLALELQEDELLRDCRMRLLCISRRLRPDYDREAMKRADGSFAPYSEHIARMRTKPHIRFGLLFSVRSQNDNSLQIIPNLVDLDIALALFHEADRTVEGWQSKVELEIGSKAFVVRPGSARVTPKQLEAYLNTLFKRFQRIFEDTGYWEPYGALELKTEAGLAVSINGRNIGTTDDQTKIVGVLPGQHTLELKRNNIEDYSTTIDVKRGQTAKLEPDLVSSDDYGFLRSTLVWSGVGIAGAGVGMIIAAVVKASALNTECLYIVSEEMSGKAPCSGRGVFYTSDYPTALGVNMRAPGEKLSSFLWGPFGYSLLTTGITWTLGTLFLGEDNELPWIQLVAGVALGGIAYGMSLALNGESIYE